MAMGLTSAQARKRLAELGENRIGSQRRAGAFTFLIAQFKSPIILILIGAAVVSLFLQDRTDAALILAMWRKQRKYCSIVTPFRPDHRPEADLCALERTPLDSRDAPNYSNHQRSRMKGPLRLSLLVAGLFCSCTVVVALRQTPARELNRILSLKHNHRRQRRYGRVITTLFNDTR